MTFLLIAFVSACAVIIAAYALLYTLKLARLTTLGAFRALLGVRHTPSALRASRPAFCALYATLYSTAVTAAQVLPR